MFAGGPARCVLAALSRETRGTTSRRSGDGGDGGLSLDAGFRDVCRARRRRRKGGFRRMSILMTGYLGFSEGSCTRSLPNASVQDVKKYGCVIAMRITSGMR